MVSRSCFGCGLLGGFFSIQQRLKTFGQVDLERLSSLLLEIVMIPVYGGVCALAHCVGFLSQIFTGALFPQLAVAQVHFPTPAGLLRPVLSGQRRRPSQAYVLAPGGGVFERFIPQIVSRKPLEGDEDGGKDSGDAG